jgi:integral membrane protein (TIGR01906 family)
VYALAFAAASLFCWREKRRLGRALFFGGVLTLAVMVAVGIIVAIDFDWFFLQFHLFSFANDFWMLNPATDYLIMLFPQGFWFDAALACAAATAAGAVILGWIGWRLMRSKGLTA